MQLLIGCLALENNYMNYCHPLSGCCKANGWTRQGRFDRVCVEYGVRPRSGRAPAVLQHERSARPDDAGVRAGARKTSGFNRLNIGPILQCVSAILIKCYMWLCQIRVNCVNPTVTMTPMGRRVWGGESEKSKEMLKRIPQNKFVGQYLRNDNPNQVVPVGLVVRIRRSHRRGRGSIPRQGVNFCFPVPTVHIYRVMYMVHVFY